MKRIRSFLGEGEAGAHTAVAVGWSELVCISIERWRDTQEAIVHSMFCIQAIMCEDVPYLDAVSLVLETEPPYSQSRSIYISVTLIFSLKCLFLPTSTMYYEAIIPRIDIRHYK